MHIFLNAVLQTAALAHVGGTMLTPARMLMLTAKKHLLLAALHMPNVPSVVPNVRMALSQHGDHVLTGIFCSMQQHGSLAMDSRSAGG